MTALSRYERLEAPARLGRVHTGAAQDVEDVQNVIVSLGKTTLTVSTLAGQPMDHWDLGTVSIAKTKAKTKDGVCHVRPDPGSDDVLILDDPDMIQALSLVVSAATRARRAPKRRRAWRWGAGSVLVAAGVVLAAAVVFKANVAGWVGPGQKAQMAQTTLAATGADLCTAPDARSVLDSLERHMAVRVSVARDAAVPLQALPDGRVVLSGSALQDLTDPAALAGVLAAANIHLAANPPLATVVDGLSLAQTARLVFQADTTPAPLVPIALGDVPAALLAQDLAVKGLPALSAADGLRALGFDGLAAETERLGRDSKNAALDIPDGAWLAFQSSCEPSA